MKILFTGKSDFTYNRDQILWKGLESIDGVEVIKYRIEKRNSKAAEKIKSLSREVDLVFIPSFRHKEVGIVTRSSAAPVIFDPLISIYMTRVLDYGHQWKSWHKQFVDKRALSRPDGIIWDTQSHADFINTKYDLNTPTGVVYIGIDEGQFHPLETLDNNTFTVGFYGSFNPLQGVDKIVRAAHILQGHKDIQFTIVGGGSTYASVRKVANDLNVRNIKWIDTIPFSELNSMINTFDVCLGVFGESIKTDVVIPNKIYHYAACAKPIITKGTMGIKELFSNDEIVTTENNPESIASSIFELYNDHQKRQTLGQSIHQLVTTKYSKKKIAESFLSFAKTII